MVSRTRKGHPTPHKLRFHEKLVGKGHSTDALQKRLKTLHSELADIDQDNVDTQSLSSVRKELISPSILLHKDKGVKAYAACCLADLLRLYAPDAPYTGAELKDIFQFFSRQLFSGLKAADGPHFTEYFYLLESLSNVKSVVLICDLPQGDDLITEFFRNFFDLIKQDLASNVQTFMSDILLALIDESSSLPSEVMEILLAQFSAEDDRSEQSAYRLAVDVCNAGADKLQRHVSQHFTDIILQHGHAEDIAHLQAAHNLIKNLNRACPALLLNVVPQIEEELKLDELRLRHLATQTLGQMFSEKVVLGSAELARKYPSTWKTWLSRQNDKAPPVRIALVEALSGLVVHHPELRQEIEEALQNKLLDPDEKVRAAACRVCSGFDYEAVVHHVSEKTLRAIGGRVLDKKHSVRVEATRCLTKLFRLAYNAIETGDPLAVLQLAWVPGALLHATALPSSDVRTMVETAFLECILPLPRKPEDESTWTEQLIVILRYLDDKALQALLTLGGVQHARSNVLDAFIQNCVENNGGVIDSNEEQVLKRLRASVQHLTVVLPEPVKGADDLIAFAKLNDNRSYKLLRSCMDPQADLKTIMKARNEFFRRLEENAAALVSTFTFLWQRFTFWMVNSSSIPTLVKKLQRSRAADDQLIRDHVRRLLSYVAKNSPAVYKAHISELAKALADDSDSDLNEIALQALAAVFRWDSDVAPNDRRLSERVQRFAEGQFARQAKLAARLLAHSRNKAQVTTILACSLASKLATANSEHLVAHLSSLAELARSAPDAYESSSDVTTAFILKDLFMRGSPSITRDDDDDWLEDVDLPSEIRAKVLALKICCNRCIAHAGSDAAVDVAKPVIKLLFDIIECRGAPFPGVEQNAIDKSRMRLQAAVSLLKLTSVAIYDKVIAARLPLLALMVQDPCYGVRSSFISKMIKFALRRRLPPRYNVIPFLTAHDPESELRDKARTYVTTSLRRLPSNMRVACFEIIFVRLLHLLAHHPDFSSSPESLDEISRYIDFYLEVVSSSENIPLLWHLAVKLKTVEDVDPDFTENLYIISELAQHLLKRRAKLHSWTISSHPAKVELPGDIFTRPRDPATVATVRQTVYLSDTLLAQVGDVAQPAKAPTMKRLRAVNDKKPSNGRRTTQPRKRRKKNTPSDGRDSDSASALTDAETDEEAEAEDAAENERAKDDMDLSGEPDTSSENLGRGARGKARARATIRAKKAKV